MSVSYYLQKDYENNRDWTLDENKPNQSQFQVSAGERGGEKRDAVRLEHDRGCAYRQRRSVPPKNCRGQQADISKSAGVAGNSLIRLARSKFGLTSFYGVHKLIASF